MKNTFTNDVADRAFTVSRKDVYMTDIKEQCKESSQNKLMAESGAAVRECSLGEKRMISSSCGACRRADCSLCLGLQWP